MRYPPIEKIINGLSISLFGINEFSVRVPQLLFAIFSAILIFKICEENFNSKEVGLISACFYMFSPVVFYYSGLAEAACAEEFFIIIIIYYYLKYVKTNNNAFLIISFYFISLGFLYKQQVLLMLAVLVISILFQKENKVRLSLILKLSYLALVPIIPYLIIGKIYPNNPLAFDFSNWFKLHSAFGYFVLLPYQLSYPLYALTVISITYLLFKKTVFRSSVFVFFVCFVLYYVFYTSYIEHGKNAYVYGVHRFAMIFYPFFSISVGLFIGAVIKSIKWKHSFKLVFPLLTIYLIVICTIWQVPPLSAQFVAYKNIESNYFPADKAMKWVKHNVKDNEKILIFFVSPYVFYRDKYGINRDKIVDFSIDKSSKISTPHSLYTFCSTNKISYIMFSYSPVYHSILVGAKEMLKLMESLKENRDNEFIKIAQYNLDGNYIYIYKIKNDGSL